MLVDPARFRTEINWFSCHNSGVSACDVLPSAGLSTESIRSPTYLFLRRLSFFPVSFMVMIIIFLSPSPACRGAIYQRCTSEDNGDNRSSACSSSALWQCFTTNPIAAKPRSLSLSLSKIVPTTTAFNFTIDCRFEVASVRSYFAVDQQRQRIGSPRNGG